METEIAVAWFTAIVAILSLAATTIAQIVFRFMDAKAERQRETLKHRREALHAALRVVDHVYANTSFDGKPPAKPHQWDIAEAWNAMNLMVVYCADPARALRSFNDAIGLHNPARGPRRGYGPADLAAFRAVVAKELGTEALPTDDVDRVWVLRLPGSST